MNRRKRTIGIGLLLLLVLLVGTCGLWLHAQQQQYARNRQLIEALVHNDSKQALALVNEGADPNTHYKPTPVPSLKQRWNQLLHRSPPPVNDSPTAFLIVCGAQDLWVDVRGTVKMSHGSDNVPLVQAMLQHGANANAPPAVKERGWTPLMYAVLAHRQNTFDVLLRHGAAVNTKDYRGWTPLMLAIFNKNAEMVDVLLQHTGDANTKDKNGHTPLKLAAQAGSTDVVRLLLQHGAEVNAQDKFGLTPLMSALGNPAILALLLQNGAAVNETGNAGQTALMYATRFPPNVVRLLLEHGADVNAENSSGQTPLMCAAEVDAAPDVVRLLLEHGADVNAKDNSGRTPLMWATLAKHPKIIPLLRQYGAK